MQSLPNKFSNNSGELPDEVRLAFLEILYHTLCCIRAFSKQPDASHALSDHAHNIPRFLEKPVPELLQFYWETMRPYFIRRIEALHQNVSIFEPSWKTIEQEYQDLKTRAAVTQ